MKDDLIARITICRDDNSLLTHFNNNTTIKPEVKLILRPGSGINTYYLSNIREHPITAKEFCERIIDKSCGESYECVEDDKYVLSVAQI